MEDKTVLSENHVSQANGGDETASEENAVHCPDCKSKNTEFLGSMFNRVLMARYYDYRCKDCGNFFRILH